MAKKKKAAAKKTVETLNHADDKRTNIPTAELQSVMEHADKSPIRVAYDRRNRDLDPQLVWRGKDEQDWSDLVVHAPPLYIQEKVHPKVLIDDLLKQTKQAESEGKPLKQLDLFADFNGLPDDARSTEFYQHEAHWTNRMILGDSLQVMASLAEREGLRGKVQCIYIDPPYGIKFNSNFQWSTTSRTVEDGKVDHVTREPEQVKAFRDTWQDGIHSYLTYLRDRLTVVRDLLHESGTVFVQIGDENVHRIRTVMDEVFGQYNAGPVILVKKKGSQKGGSIESVNDYILPYYKNAAASKYRQLYEGFQDESEISRDFSQSRGEGRSDVSLAALAQRDEVGSLYKVRPLLVQERYPRRKLFTSENITAGGRRKNQSHLLEYEGKSFDPGLAKGNCWKHTAVSDGSEYHGMGRLAMADRLYVGDKQVRYVRYFDDFGMQPISNWWDGFGGAKNPQYVVQTSEGVVERCLLMATDPGDLVLDPTCGSGTIAYVAEQWGRRWITIDTSRVALALARARIMGARFPYYLLADSREGQLKEAEVTRSAPSDAVTLGHVRQGFVNRRVSHITSAVIANNSEIDVIWDRFQETLEPLRERLNGELGRVKGKKGQEPWEEWEIPREAGELWVPDAVAAHAQIMALKEELRTTLEVLDSLELSEHADKVKSLIVSQAKKPLETLNGLVKAKYTFDNLPDEPREPWPKEARKLHAEWWKQRIARQQEIDASIAAKADFEYLYDKPYEDKSKVRVAGPFTVESVSPHRVLGVDENDELIDPQGSGKGEEGSGKGDGDDFVRMILENLKTAGVQQAHKEDRITFTSLTPWPGDLICAEGRYVEGDTASPQSSDSEEEGATGGTEKRAGILIGPEFGTVSKEDLAAAAREAGDAGFDVLISCAFNYESHASEFSKRGRLPILKARMNADLHMADDLKNTGKGNLFVIFGEPDIGIYEGGSSKLKDEVKLTNERIPEVEAELADIASTIKQLKADLKKAGKDEDAKEKLTREVEACDLQKGNLTRELNRCREFVQLAPRIPAGEYVVKIFGVDVFHPSTGEVRSDGAEGIACWFIDTSYNEESFFVRHAYFLGANDPYKALKTTLKAEINAQAWDSLHSDTSRPFTKPRGGRIAVKVINHLGDEVMKVFRV